MKRLAKLAGAYLILFALAAAVTVARALETEIANQM